MGAGAWMFIGAIFVLAAYFWSSVGYSFDEDNKESAYAKTNEEIIRK